MRLIRSTHNPEEAKRFCSILSQNKLEYTCEEEINQDWGSPQFSDRVFHIWIYDEDNIEKATALLEHPESTPAESLTQNEPPPFTQSTDTSSLSKQFLANKLRTPLDQQGVQQHIRTHMRITAFIILLCSVLFFVEAWSVKERGIPPAARQMLLTTTPIERALLYDYPSSYELLDKIVSLYGPEAILKPNSIPPAGRFLYKTFTKESTWQGVYPELINYIRRNYTTLPQIPYNLEGVQLFGKISQGEIWRLFSPAFLHTDLLHLFFNMAWLLILGTQIETKIRGLRFVVLIAILAAFSNTGEYLMSGPNFLGFSGVICGMATFIRTRQKNAPWEAYPMSKNIYWFILFFIGIVAALSVGIFFVNAFQGTDVSMRLANTAHITGALAGIVLGNLRWFSWQPRG